jgi:type III pantothenate kinase
VILEVDIGNTRLKWRVRDKNLALARGTLDTLGAFSDLEGPLSDYRNLIKAVWIANVAGIEIEKKFSSWCDSYLHCRHDFVRSVELMSGVRNGYIEPRLLGVDRWLGLLAAYQCSNKACVVVSCGTAMTLDLIDNEGRHLGGFIAPGLRILISSLASSARQISLNDDVPTLTLSPGHTTKDCVYAGVALMIKGLIDNGVRELDLSAQEFDLILTGGDSSRLQMLYPQARFNPDLVLDGLACAMANSKLLE